jgi:hypothetical protein
LNPLDHPIKITIFTVPPENGGKDLDNLALNVIPLIHEILRPPTFQKLGARRLQTSMPISGVHQEMVTSYEVIELPRN